MNILVCGWGKHTFMNDFIAELDDGYAKLPPGSKLVFVNEHTDAQTLAQTHQVTDERL